MTGQGVKTPNMTLLVSNTAVEEFCAAASAEPFITVDTEFLRDNTYWPKICLIQIACKNQAIAIDPLIDGIDLTPVWNLLVNPKILKVFHACRQDMEVFLNISGQLPAPIYDTQIAAMMLGLGDQIGYDNLLKQVLDRQIDKTSQYSDWSLRPLETGQLAYALGDVTHLYEAYVSLQAALKERGREAWVHEEMASLTYPETYDIDPAKAWRRLKIKSPSKPFLAALKCLAEWRENLAQERDVPRSRVLKDDVLVDLAVRRPKSEGAMMRQRGIGEQLAKGKIGQAILRVLARAETLPESEIPKLPPKPRPIPGVVARSELLRTLLKICADRADIAPRALASTADLDALARDQELNLTCLSGWRRDLFGNYALDLLQGKLWLGMKDGKLAMSNLST